MTQEYILDYLRSVKAKYMKEGIDIKALFGSYSRNEQTSSSDVDILIEATPEFANKYGFGAISRLHEVELELAKVFNTKVDLADITGMGKTAKKFIIDRAIYV
ncbi:MAG: nucleotidyltransferase domain-containing protein [Campylobacterota bacterium]|nr:nucleotidyltransferase domain-containing protein [Campylobacterota bacterium]